MYYYSYLDSTIGKIYVVYKEKLLESVILTEEKWNIFKSSFEKNECDGETLLFNSDHCRQAVDELKEYFIGERIEFTVPFSIRGTEFQQRVWNELRKIPYGETRSYKDIAISIGKEKAVRAIGQANKANPLPIIIPCHRVISENGKLCGYMGSRMDIKSVLLNQENAL
jgi:methylated-DNA-[protein]-cysteine S-methyltransferase